MTHFKYIDKTEDNVTNSICVATTQMEQILIFCPPRQSEGKPCFQLSPHCPFYLPRPNCTSEVGVFVSSVLFSFEED